MLGYLAGAFLYGAVKARAVGRPQEHFSTFLQTSPLGELTEELEFRVLGEDVVGKRLLRLAPAHARVAQAALFGLSHAHLGSFNMVEAGLAGLAYSYIYERHGLKGSFLAHLAHNLGAWTGSV